MRSLIVLTFLTVPCLGQDAPEIFPRILNGRIINGDPTTEFEAVGIVGQHRPRRFLHRHTHQSSTCADRRTLRGGDLR